MTGLGRSVLGAACLALSYLPSTTVLAQSGTVTVECHSVSYQYSECRAPLRAIIPDSLTLLPSLATHHAAGIPSATQSLTEKPVWMQRQSFAPTMRMPR